jgi:heme/copper-type cytochrome/quinol oxidase subunit 2
MSEPCDDLENCENICKTSIHYGITKKNFIFIFEKNKSNFFIIANSKLNLFTKPSSLTWIILVIAILGILIITIIIMTIRYRRQRKNTPVPSRMFEKENKCQQLIII